MVYTVFWVGDPRDGEILGKFETEGDAVNFAAKFENEHEAEFEPVCGGIAIDDEDGNPVEW